MMRHIPQFFWSLISEAILVNPQKNLTRIQCRMFIRIASVNSDLCAWVSYGFLCRLLSAILSWSFSESWVQLCRTFSFPSDRERSQYQWSTFLQKQKATVKIGSSKNSVHTYFPWDSIRMSRYRSMKSAYCASSDRESHRNWFCWTVKCFKSLREVRSFNSYTARSSSWCLNASMIAFAFSYIGS